MSRVALRAQRFAHDRGLHHNSSTVELSVLEDEFIPVYDDLTAYATLGYGLFPPDGVVSLDRPAKIYLERTLTDQERRLVYAHEIGHYVAGHLASPVTATINNWQHDRDEKEAWIAAAALLIPFSALASGECHEEIATNAGVPKWMVGLYREHAI